MKAQKDPSMTIPSPAAIATAAADLQGAVIETPLLPLTQARWAGLLPEGADVSVKLELFQQAGSFKARGALLGIKRLSAEDRARGVVAASGGNHALAVAWASRQAGIDALITMPRTVDPVRIEGCRALGATVDLYDTMADAFTAMEAAAEAGRTLMHPFEGAHMTLGAATCGAEFARQLPGADVFVIPVGGGGLIGGVGTALKQAQPDARLIGVEPFGADSITRSRKAGHPVTLDRIDTIADSLSAPKALPMSFAVADACIDDMVHIDDDAMRAGMRHYRDILHLVAEPACAAALAAICGPLKSELAGQRVGIIACGSNIGAARWKDLAG